MIVKRNTKVVRAAMLALVFLVCASCSAQIEVPGRLGNPNKGLPLNVDARATGQTSRALGNSPEQRSQSRNWHAQSTVIVQGYPSVHANYSGVNSLPSSGQARETVSLDLYGGYRLWNGAEAHIDILTWQGFGLHGTLGIDDFPNGEAYKVGTSTPHTNIARLFVRQTIGIRGAGREEIHDDQLSLAGDQPVNRLVLTVGRFSSKDVFDDNSYANDPRTQFMNWSLMANTAWDYPSDSLGYTTGVAFELNQPKWTWRYGFFQLPSQRNGFTAESRFWMWPGDTSAGDGPFWRCWGMATEGERRYAVNAHPGAIRILGSLNQGNFGSYRAARSVPGADISLTRAIRGTYGFGLNAEQEITRTIGVFSRVGWNDGHNESWMFSDINSSASLGISIKGEGWHRQRDTVGLAGMRSGISRVNQQYLAAGGLGILDGDGALDYASEKAVEAYYDYAFSKKLHATLDYQFFANPAFNHARGPLSVFGSRVHWEF